MRAGENAECFVRAGQGGRSFTCRNRRRASRPAIAAYSDVRWGNRAVLKMAVPFDLLTIVRMMPASLPTVRRPLGQPSQRENHVIR